MTTFRTQSQKKQKIKYENYDLISSYFIHRTKSSSWVTQTDA